MSADTHDTPPAMDGNRAAQPAVFIAALDEHRAQVGTAHPLAVLVIRLDRFQHACDTLGPARANLLRAEVKSRVASLATMPAVMQWLGPADLGVACLLPEGTDDPGCLSMTIAAVLGRPYLVDGFELFLSCSIGAAMDHPDSATERNLQQAFDAMLQINRRGGDGVGRASLPTPPRMAPLLAALPHAIARGELSLHLQPRALLSTAEIVAYTVRLRWQHAVLGRIAPHDFLPAVEALGMMDEMGQWILQQLLPLMRATETVAPVPFTLLASSSQLQSPGSIDMLRRAVEAYGVGPGRLCVEVPVSIVPDSPETAHKATLLHDTGIGMALSDFTDNAASLRALEITRPDVVTLDARHLGHATRSGDIAAHLRAACVLAHAHGVPVCAKGVETRTQLEAVRDWGCDSVQGYLLAQPFPAHWLAQTHAAIVDRARQLLGPGLRP
ncbi:diguanylate cyclase/phosphodiesterase [Cupriavidus sp. OV038]|uniref:GGDEF domain-containing protein n=1 Tax=unclassified Cupriavidus TaxID=2640874 RepID=UPI0008F43EF8|nr:MULTISPECIES: GGDEF domain-containing protein [unclassified Cupriavidus]SFC92819.1 diguanylate cyclase/phosphodiesterase [Cupriavidus sp. OV038]SFP57129.1 diguanylate cyclase/phosphodiesterase [Cupriavidus sp. OV096]